MFHKMLLVGLVLCAAAWGESQTIAEMPFKKTLLITSVLLFQEPHKDTSQLMKMMSQYAAVESDMIGVLLPLREARQRLKNAILANPFRSKEDFNQVPEASHIIDELDRDHRITFSPRAKPDFAAIKNAALNLQQKQKALEAHPLFPKSEETRKELKKQMAMFLEANYSDMQRVRKSWDEATFEVDAYLNAALI